APLLLEVGDDRNSEGGSAPLPNLPPGIDCAGKAGARTTTSSHQVFVRHASSSFAPRSGRRWQLGGGRRPPPHPPPRDPVAVDELVNVTTSTPRLRSASRRVAAASVAARVR